MSMVWSDRNCSWNLSHLACSPPTYHINPWLTTIFRSILGSLILRHTQIILPSLENDPLIVQKTKNLRNPRALEGALQSWLLSCHKQAFIPNNQATKCCSWWFGCFGFLFNTTLKFYNTRHSLWTKPSYNMEARSNLRQPFKKKRQQPSHHHGSTPALHWQRQWQHSCRAYPTWSVPFPAEKPGIFPSRL